MKSYINSIGTANPLCSITQDQAASFMCGALDLNYEEQRKLKAIYRASGISKRHSVIEDYLVPWQEYKFYPQSQNLEPFPTISKRMQLYKENACKLALRAIQDGTPNLKELKNVTHLITVSCTGMYAPGVDLEIVHELGLSGNTQRLAINFMGCYAAFNALKTGDAICKSFPDAKVLIVCIELCSLHFQKSFSTDQLISNAIFSDGAAAVVMEPNPSQSNTSLSLESFFCDIAIDGKSDMAWHIADHGFEMTLSAYVPDLLRQGINKLANGLYARLGIQKEDVSLYAIHPGGKKILEALELELGISRKDNQYAYEVLKEFGNMSSATVLFVLKRILYEESENLDLKNILSLAFGPGLTIESMILKVNAVVKNEVSTVHMNELAEV